MAAELKNFCMKIAYFIGTLKKEDGVTRVLLSLINEGLKKGVQSIIITGWAEDVSLSPVPVIKIPSIVFPLYRAYRLSLPGTRKFQKQLDEFKPDIIHLHSPDTIAWSALKYAKRRRIPIVATHNTDFCKYFVYYNLGFLRPFAWFLLRRLYKQMSFTTTPSQVMAQELIDHRIPNVLTIPWGVDFVNFDISFRSPDWRQKIIQNENKLILLCVCRLTWEKDLRTLAEAYKLLKAKRNDFVMVVAGEGPVRKELEQLMPGVIFLGHIEGIELSQAYASSDIFVFPSTTETFGNVTIEAMASGLVPVVADAGGSKSLVKDGENGFLTRPKEAPDIFQKVNILLDEAEIRERIRSASLEFSKNFAWEKVFNKLFQMYLPLRGPAS
ncbi:glycosyltransferase family 1 protein [Patescibacteria group bacterium]|nr:glycosyltransferase family 1 protein [Patescibacteria group bacterium]